MKVYLLIEFIGAWNSDEFGSPLYGIPAPVCEKVIDAFYTEEKALEALEKAELSSKKMVEELMCDPCEYSVVEYELKG